MRRHAAFLALLPLLAAGPLGAQSAAPAATRPGELRLVVAATGNEARYLVRERLAELDLPNDAIGTTSAITGQVVLDPNGTVDSAASRITIDLTTLTSDRRMRDNYIKRRTLVTDSFPRAELSVKELRGLPATLPDTGTLALTLVADLTVHGVTRPTTWEVTARAGAGVFTGTARTTVRFEDFGMEKPRLARLLSVADEIRLEYDFRLERQP